MSEFKSVYSLNYKTVFSIVAVDPLDILNLNVAIGTNVQIKTLCSGGNLETQSIYVACPQSNSVS